MVIGSRRDGIGYQTMAPRVRDDGIALNRCIKYNWKNYAIFLSSADNVSLRKARKQISI